MASGIDGAGPDTRSNTTDAGADAPTAAMDEAQISSTRDWAGHAECGRLLGWGGWRKTLKGGGKPRAGLAHDALGPNPALGQSTAFCCSERAVVVQGEAHASANRSPDCGTYSASDTMAQRCADAHADGHTDTSYMGPFVFTNTVANTGADTSHGNTYTGTDCSTWVSRRGDGLGPGPVCPNDCSGHGACNATCGECACEPGYGGDDCSVSGEHSITHEKR